MYKVCSRPFRGHGTPGFLIFTPKEQEPSFYFIYAKRFYWLELHFYTSSKMARNIFFWGEFWPRLSLKLEPILCFRFWILREKTYRNYLSLVKCLKRNSKMSDSVINYFGKNLFQIDSKINKYSAVENCGNTSVSTFFEIPITTQPSIHQFYCDKY